MTGNTVLPAAGGARIERDASRAPVQLRFSVRAKGMIAFVVIVLYTMMVGLIVAQERQKLFATVQELERVHDLEETLAKVNTSVAHAVLREQAIFYAPDPQPGYEALALDIEAIQARLEGLRRPYPKIDGAIARLGRNVASLRAVPARAALAELRASLYDLVAELDAFTRQVGSRRSVLSEGYRLIYDAITLTVIIGGVVGVVVFGGLTTLFFSRLARDLRRLESQALAVVTGYRDDPLEVTRHDEIGSLMESVNRMQSALRNHEKQLEITRQQRFHQDKMAAIGSLAAAVAHEINNPIAAIHGIAEAMDEIRRSHRCPGVCQPTLILEQTGRITQITRQMSEMTSPLSAEPQLIDINGLVRNTCNFVAYDRRFRNVKLALDLDGQVPAAVACADHVTQVLMNLLINSADASEAVTDRVPEVRVATVTRNGSIEIAVSDNGCGMDADTRVRAFEETFTTKPAGKGSGLGLFICKSLIERSGGSIKLKSEPGSGTRATFTIPLESRAAIA